jgi:hypothetical protein
MPQSIVLLLPPTQSVEELALAAREFGEVYETEAEPGRFIVDMADEYVAFTLDRQVLDEYSEDEQEIISRELGHEFIPVVFEFRNQATAWAVLQAVLPGIACVVDDDHGSLETCEVFLTRLARLGDRWLHQ